MNLTSSHGSAREKIFKFLVSIVIRGVLLPKEWICGNWREDWRSTKDADPRQEVHIADLAGCFSNVLLFRSMVVIEEAKRASRRLNLGY